MDLDVKELIKIRLGALAQIEETGEAPVDILFHVINDKMGFSPVPFEGDFPPSFKYNARKQAVNAFIAGTANPALKNASRLVYFSSDLVYDVDYCFDIDMTNNDITLYIVKDGNIVRRFKNYKLNYDERPDLENL